MYYTTNFCTQILDFGGFDSSIIFIVRAGTLMPIRDFPESLSQGILVGIILERRLGVSSAHRSKEAGEARATRARALE